MNWAKKLRECVTKDNTTRNGCNEAIDAQVNEVLLNMDNMQDWKEFIVELNKINEYEALYWTTYNRIRYLKSWLNGMDIGDERKSMIEKELGDIEAQLIGLKGGLNLTKEDADSLLKEVFAIVSYNVTAANYSFKGKFNADGNLQCLYMSGDNCKTWEQGKYITPKHYLFTCTIK